MFNQLLISEVFNQPWCIEKQYAQGLFMSALGIIKNQSTPAEQRMKYQMPFALDKSNKKQSGDYAKGSIGVITLDGPVVETSDPWNGIKGTAELSQELNSMYADPNIAGVVFACNTGGGAAYATKVMNDTMASRPKPVGVLAKQTLCSAGVDITCGADLIYMYHPQGIAGSIGTMCSFTDMQPMFEKWGIAFHEIYASLSTLKNNTFNQALEGNYQPLIAKMLDPMNVQFVARVKASRGSKIDVKEKGIYKGETYMAEQAVTLGLLDGIGNLFDVASQVRSISGTGVYRYSAPTSTQNFPDMKYPKLTALLTALEGGTVPTQEELDAVNAEWTTAGIKGVAVFPESVITDHAQAITDLGVANAEVTRLNNELTTANTSLGTFKTENAALKIKVAKGPAAAAPIVGATDPITEKTAEQKGAEIISTLPHNQGILDNPLFMKI